MSPQPPNLAALREHLAAGLAAQLDATGDLPAAARAALAADLRAQIAACAAYIPARLVKAQIADPRPGRVSGAFWEGSLLFADLSGFTALSERLSVLGRQGAEEVSAVVSGLFDALIAEIHAHQGALLKFGGDAITAFFDSEVLEAAHAAAATAAALAMQRRMAGFVGLETRAGSFTLQLRVGVHSGRVFAAEVGDASHVELVVTGPEVNRVAMAQEIAAPGEVVVSEQTAALLDGAALRPAEGGFLLAEALPPPRLPAPTSDPVALYGPDDLATLARLADRLAALRPYLVRRLPRRFLEAAETGLGEFRPVSVLFANVHDFSAVLERLQHDPDRAAAIFNAYYRRAQAVVHRYDGIVNKVDMYTHGDKLMALFGAPAAHEDDPTRAVRCALELREALEEANAEIAGLLPDAPGAAPGPFALAQKIGINTGTVFAGRVGGATRYEYTVMGPAVNLAARLMSAAADDEVLLSPSARAAVAGQVVLEEAAPLRLKGIAAPVVPARALRLAGVASASRDDARAGRLDVAPLIGRDAELRALLADASAALGGRGRVLALVGDAGAGKTRLAEELLQRLVVESVAPGQPGIPPFEIFLGDCQSYEQRTPYAAIGGPLRDLLGLGARRDEAIPAHLLGRVRQLAPELERFTPLLGDAIGLPVADTPLTAALTPQQRHDRLQDLVVALFQGAARRDPLLVGVEDVHWADLPSQELLARLAEAADGLPMLLVLTYRLDPPIDAPWDDLPLTSRLALGELGQEQSAALLGALLGGSPPQAILPLLDRTQGNPFFIEELVRALVGGGVLVRDDEAGPWRLARRLEEVELPKSIEGLLIARLDRLDEPRQELVQVASVIGRRFPLPVVAGVYAAHEPLDESLQRLISFELIQAEQLERTLAYLFRHALLRDVAYEGILYARRRVLHGRVARRIEELSRELPDDQLALLAWHFYQAEEWRPALDYHVRAADQAARRFANRDAVALYATALAIVQRLEGSMEPGELGARRAAIEERSGELRLLLGELDDAEAHFRAALALAGPASESTLRLHRLLASVEERRSRYDEAFEWLRVGMARATSAMRGETARCYLLGAGIYYRQSEFPRAMEWARMGLSLAEQVGSQADQAHALLMIGNLRQEQGDLAQSIEAFEQARALFEGLNDISRASSALNNLGSVYLRAGRWQDTIACYEESLRIGESIGDALAVARTANNLAVVLVGRDQLERAGQLYQLSSEMFGRIGSALGVAVTTYNRGEVLLLQGRPAEALPLFESALADLERIKARSFLPEALRLAAEASLALGAFDTAREQAGRSLAVAAELGLAADEAATRRAIGQIALAAGDLGAADEELERSRAALAQLDSRYDLGKTRYQQARLARARGDAAAFAAARAEAEAIFAELDAQRDLALVRQL